jgi:hypothetical protein
MTPLRLTLPALCAAVLITSALPTPAAAATLVWPSLVGVSPCTGTLQACINLAAAGDTVAIGTDELLFPDAYTLVDESVVINKAIALTAARDIDAVFAPGRSIAVDTGASVSGTVTVSNLSLRRGTVSIRHGSTASVTYAVSRVRVLDSATADCLIHATDIAGTTGAAQVTIGDNVLSTDPAGAPAVRPGGICVTSANAPMRTDIFRNRIEVASARLLRAISVTGAGITHAFVSNNIIRGQGFAAGISMSLNGVAATRRLVEIRSNFIRGQRAPGGSSEAGIGMNGQSLDVRITNNTVIDGMNGVALRGAALNPMSGDVIGRFANNIVAFNTGSGLFLDPAGTATLVNDYNLVHQNAFDAYTPGPNTLTSNPQFGSLLTGALEPSSPAVNSGNNADLPILTGFDAAGTPRRINTTVDRGAFEYSDDRSARHVVTAASASFNTSRITELGQLGPGEFIAVTPHHSAAPDATQNPGAYLQDPSPAQYAVFNQNSAVNLSLGRRFSVIAPLFGYAAFRHTSTPGSSIDEFTQLDHPELNSRSFAIAIASASFESDAGVAYHDHPIGLEFFSNRWYVRNQDLAGMQFGHGFNVIVAPLGAPGAFTVTVPSARNTVVLAHPFLDDNACAAPQVGRGDDPGDGVRVANATPFSVEYVPSWSGFTGRWMIRAEGSGSPTFPAGAAFNVIVEGNQAIGCNAAAFASDVLFADGFE